MDADCGAGNFCALRICVLGCSSADNCDGSQVCDLHGRCAVHEDDPPRRVLAGIPALAERLTVLAPSETQAHSVLRNDGAAPLVYRLAAASPVLKLDTSIAELGPAAEIELVADVDLAALGPADRVLPVQIITSGGAILWSLELAAVPESGHFRGVVSFSAEEFSLASSDLTIDLDFRAFGMNLHAATTADGRDRKQLERICRYLLRPPFAHDAVTALPGGRVRVSFKAPWRSGTAHADMDAHQFLARLCDMIDHR
jgi:hypothetical protein